MPSDVDRTAGELDWPHWAPRSDRRERTSKFSVTLAQAINRLEAELEDRVGVDDWRLSTAAPHRKRGGRPYADANPDDPGAVVRWSKDGQQYAVACDHYDGLRDNVRAIGLYVREKRKMADRPVETGQDEFATAALPSGNEDAIAVGDGSGTASVEAPHEVLDVAPEADPEVVKAAARRLKAKHHPDSGEDPDRERFMAVSDAEERMLDG